MTLWAIFDDEVVVVVGGVGGVAVVVAASYSPKKRNQTREFKSTNKIAFKVER